MSAASSRTRVLEIGALGLGLGVVGVLAAHPLSSPDTFWHLKLGEIIAQTGSVPRTDMFSAVHPERRWVQFSWLWELLAYAATAHGGLRALRIAQAGLMIVSFATFYALLRRASQRISTAFSGTACALALFADRFQARPDATSLLLATLAAPAVLGFRRAGLKLACGVAALALLWVNLHAGTSLLFGCTLLSVFCGAVLNTRLRCGPCAHSSQAPDAAWRAAGLFALWLAALLLTPQAVPAIAHFSSALSPIMTAREQEWSPSLTMLAYGAHPAYFVVAFAPWLVATVYVRELAQRYRALGRAGFDFAELLPCAALLTLSALVVRSVFVCLLPFVLVLLRSKPSSRGRRAQVLLALAVALAAVDLAGRDAYGGLARARVAFTGDLAPGAYPEHAAAFMRRAGVRGKVLNFPRWGDYLIERLFPACSVFFDSRRDITPEMQRLLSDVARPDLRSDALERAFRRFGTELVVYDAPLFTRYRPERPWLLLYKAGPEEVYQHAQGQHAGANVACTRRDFAGRTEALPAAPEDAAWTDTITRAGSREWLRDPWQRQLVAEQAGARTSSDPSTHARGERALGLLLFRAGAYARAAELLQAQVARDPSDASARYHLVFALLADGEPEASARNARAMPAAGFARLNPAQRYRFNRLVREARAR